MAAYAEHRPDYAQAAVGWALEPAPGPRVLDLGAGTGKLTATLVALGAEVIAVEPDPAMLTELRRALSSTRPERSMMFEPVRKPTVGARNDAPMGCQGFFSTGNCGAVDAAAEGRTRQTSQELRCQAASLISWWGQAIASS